MTLKQRILASIIICFFSTIKLIGQTNSSSRMIDSLLNVLKNVNDDTLKVNTLNMLAEKYISVGNSNFAIQKLKESQQLAEKIEFSSGLINSFNLIGDVYEVKGDSASAMANYKKALSIAIEKENKKWTAETYNAIGILYYNKSDLKNALDNYLKARVIREAIGDKKGMASSYGNIGIIYEKRGDFDKALDNFINAEKIQTAINDKGGLIASYNNIGNIHLSQNNLDMALVSFKKSLAMAIDLDDKSETGILYNNIGIIYKRQKKYLEALECYSKALSISKQIDFKVLTEHLLGNIGLVYSEKNETDKALETYLEGLKLCEEMGDKMSEGLFYNNIGVIYLNDKKITEALNCFNKALIIDKERGFNSSLKDVYLSLANLHEKQNNFKQAYEYHKLYSDLKDSLLNEESSKQITEMNAKYESDKKEKEIELLTKDKELQGAEISKQKLIRNGTIGGLVIALLFAFVLLNRFKVTNRQKKIIEYQNSQIVESINYSKKIQDSLLPSISLMQQVLPSLFVFNSPKDIVSGDFYYLKEVEKYIVIACVDCTGHGVPGGFMSTLGSLLLDKIVDSGVLQPSEILLKLSDEIIRVLHQQNGGDIQDGMDLSVCLIDKENNTLEFSGARNGIVIVSNNEAKRYKANPLPVGGNYIKKGVAITRNFQTEKIQLQPSDWVYMYTDGFMEQSGGVGSVPMTSIEFENKLVLLSQRASENKMQFLQNELDVWRGSNERADDVLVIGFKIV